MEKIDSKIETIFSHAVALNQSGRLRNSIYVIDKEIYILNSDRSVLLKFTLPNSSSGFNNPISFKASDYDSNKFYEKNGKIVFKSEEGEYVKEKMCSTAMDPKSIKEIYSNFKMTDDKIKIQLNKSVLSFLEENLSHIEIYIENKEFNLIQRDIYEGSILCISKQKKLGFGLSSDDSIPYDFGPIGIRTSDFMALFSFNDTLSFYFSKDDNGFCKVFGRNFKMSGVIAYCTYDQMGTINTLKENEYHGRQIAKKRQRK